MCSENHTFVVTGIPGQRSRMMSACHLTKSITLSEANRLWSSIKAGFNQAEG